MLLHSLKKKVSLATKTVETSAEFELFKNLLDRVRKNLETSSKALEASNALWLEQFKSHRDFSASFSAGYVPASEDDNVDAAARDFSDASTARHARYVKETSLETASYHRIHASILEYIKEIEALEATYPAVVAAKSEADRYQSKVDSMEKSKKVKDEKKSRNIDKQDTCKEKYDALLTKTVAAQKATYAKAPIVSQMALTAYWLAQSHQMEIMDSSMAQARKYARENEKDMCALNVAAVDIDIKNVSLTKSLPVPSSLPSVPTSLPPSPASDDHKTSPKPAKHRFSKKVAA